MLLFAALFLKLWRFTNTACLSQLPNRQKRRDVKWVRISSKAQFVALLLHEHKDRFLFNRFLPLFIWICIKVRIYCRFESQRLWGSNPFEEAEFTRKAIFARAHVFLLMVRHSQYLHENIAERQRKIACSIFHVLFETSLIGCCTTVMIWVFSTVSPANELYEFIRICIYNQSTTSTTSTRTLSGPKVVKRDTRVRLTFALRVETLIFHDFSSMIRPLQWFANLDWKNWNETSNEISWNFTAGGNKLAYSNNKAFWFPFDNKPLSLLEIQCSAARIFAWDCYVNTRAPGEFPWLGDSQDKNNRLFNNLHWKWLANHVLQNSVMDTTIKSAVNDQAAIVFIYTPGEYSSVHSILAKIMEI